MSGLAAIHSFSGSLPELQDPCAVCRNSFEEGEEVVVHGEDNLHPIHSDCLKSWAKVKPNDCPTCRGGIDTSGLMSNVDKVERVLKDSGPWLTAGVGLQLLAYTTPCPFYLGMAAYGISGILGAVLAQKNQNQVNHGLFEKTISSSLLAVGVGLSILGGMGWSSSWMQIMY